jgi:hypothetical protein
MGRRGLRGLHGLCPSSGKEKAFAESTLDLDNNGRKWFRELVQRSQRLPERLRFGGLFLCLNVSCLIERVRGSRFRAVRRHREDFAKADRHFQKRTDRDGLTRFEPENRQALVVGIQRANTNVRAHEIAD